MEIIAYIILTFAVSVQGQLPLDHTPPPPEHHLPLEHDHHTPPAHHNPTPPYHNPAVHGHDLLDNTPPTPPHHHTRSAHHPVDHGLIDEHGGCHGHDCDLVDAAINNVGMYFDDHLCHVFIGVDCDNHVLTNDEQLCGSDGQTYANHCLFGKVRCARILDHSNYLNPLNIVNHGPCILSTVPTHTTGQATTSASPEMSATPTQTGSTDTTTMAMNSLLGTIFCKNKWSINCGQDFNVVCGSDGKKYPNECELLKWQCEIPTLRKVSCM